MRLLSRDETDQNASLDRAKLVWFRQKIRDWAKTNLRDFPWRHTSDPYALFIAEFLLQQTDAPKVVPVYHRLLESYPTHTALQTATLADLAELLQPLGLHYRASRLFRSVVSLRDDYDGKIPSSEQELLRLPGVGRYMARSVCANAFGHPLAVLDTNVARILQRFFGITPKRTRPRDDTYMWNVAQQVAPKREVGLWNLSLIDFGSAVCTARNPKCGDCPVQRRCTYAKTAAHYVMLT